MGPATAECRHLLYSAGTVQVASPEELSALASISDLKARYRAAWGDHQMARSEAQYCAGLLEVCRQQLATEFEAWWAVEGGGGRGDGTSGVPAEAAKDGWPLPGASADGMGGVGGSRQGSAASAASSMLLGGLTSPGGGSLLGGWSVGRSAAASPPQGAPRPAQRHGGVGAGGGAVPLASIVVAAAAEAAAQGNAAAAAYFQAQQGTWLTAGAPRPGSVKKHRAERGTFSRTQRSA
jgi:hypothetical protein